uniref:VWFA domain-containing protein n=1 Tax=Arundo donax TaxID=35708 RepID=A0A0A8YGF7_ARUDO
MGAGGGQAIFTAECSHTFHFNCISASVAHGHLVCPLCNAQWRELPFLRPTQPSPVPPTLPPQGPLHGAQPPPIRHQPVHAATPLFQPTVPEVFDDDEQVDPPSGQDGPAAASSGTLVVKTHTEYSAVARGSSHDNFAVLVHVKAPGIIDAEAAASEAPRAPLDLVTVLDVSGSMSGEKIALLKQAMGFVIDNLGPGDRLSVVSFSSGARRVTRLLRMSDTGKGIALSAVESLAARRGTNIAEGLRTAAKVLDERRYRNAVSSVILLSDGQDNYTMPQRVQGAPNYEALVPPFFMRSGTGDWSVPIHTFGFGNDHDAAAMHVIAESTGGTFSFIENEAVIQDAFGQCIGGLLTVVVQEARIAIACGHPGVRISSVKSGRYESRIDEDGRSASIRVGELYADEERRFLLFLAVPIAEATDGEAATTLIKVSCSYRDAAGGAGVNVTAEDTVVTRPEHVVGAERSVEVERERVRVEATEDIAAARVAAERGAYQEAVEILENRQRAVAQSEAVRGGDAASQALETELREMRSRVSNRASYARSGRAYMLAGINMHAQQRANSRQMHQLSAAVNIGIHGASRVGQASMNSMAFINGPGGARVSNAAAPEGIPIEMAATSSYATPAMRAMLLRSHRAREPSTEQQQPPKAGEEAGSSGPKEVVNQ